MTSPIPYQSIIPEHALQTLAERWIAEDCSSGFDTAAAAVGASPTKATLYLKSPGVVAGIPFFNAVMKVVGCTTEWLVTDGTQFEQVETAKIPIASVCGPACALLRGERIALNAIAECSGVATAARRASEIARIREWQGRVAMTRKTTPGFRIVQKYGVIVGGMDPHRFALSGMCMLKDNHINACGGNVEEAIRRVRACGGFSVKVEVECANVEEALRAGRAGADVVMLDNMTPDVFVNASKLVKQDFPSIIVEGSGGLNFDTLGEYMVEYADILSFSVNRFATPLDMSLKIDS